jgi:hypothetical protein
MWVSCTYWKSSTHGVVHSKSFHQAFGKIQSLSKNVQNIFNSYTFFVCILLHLYGFVPYWMELDTWIFHASYISTSSLEIKVRFYILHVVFILSVVLFCVPETVPNSRGSCSEKYFLISYPHWRATARIRSKYSARHGFNPYLSKHWNNIIDSNYHNCFSCEIDKWWLIFFYDLFTSGCMILGGLSLLDMMILLSYFAAYQNPFLIEVILFYKAKTT